MILAALTGMASSIMFGWWLYTVDWRLGTAFVLAFLTLFINVWTQLENGKE